MSGCPFRLKMGTGLRQAYLALHTPLLNRTPISRLSFRNIISSDSHPRFRHKLLGTIMEYALPSFAAASISYGPRLTTAVCLRLFFIFSNKSSRRILPTYSRIAVRSTYALYAMYLTMSASPRTRVFALSNSSRTACRLLHKPQGLRMGGRRMPAPKRSLVLRVGNGSTSNCSIQYLG